MKNVALTVLAENLVYSKRLSGEHGLSLLLQAGDTSILFDCGQSGIFLTNALELRRDIGTVEHCVISHGHYDHTGGLPAFLAHNDTAPIWIAPEAFIRRSNAKGEQIGISPQTRIPETRIRHGEAYCEIAEDVFLLRDVPEYYSEDMHTKGFFREAGDQLADDTFDDEQSLVLRHEDAISIISGCSHRGITNIVQHAKEHFGLAIRTLVGGFHLKGDSDECALKTIKRLDTFGIGRIGVCHCSGVDKYALMKATMKTPVFYCHTGSHILL